MYSVQDISFFDSETVGGLTSRLGSDCQQVSRVIGNDINLILRNVLQVCCSCYIGIHFTVRVWAESLIATPCRVQVLWFTCWSCHCHLDYVYWLFASLSQPLCWYMASKILPVPFPLYIRYFSMKILCFAYLNYWQLITNLLLNKYSLNCLLLCTCQSFTKFLDSKVKIRYAHQ